LQQARGVAGAAVFRFELLVPRLAAVPGNLRHLKSQQVHCRA
jgi:hypothetical protein